jgi:Arc/MetJ-type ribon-helix-helix transcriptional regulator
MKSKISVTLNEKTIFGILDKLRDDKFRNKSHVVEFALKRFLEEENGR